MNSEKINNIHLPQVGLKKPIKAKATSLKEEVAQSEFTSLLKKTLAKNKKTAPSELNFSKHAVERLKMRNVIVDASEHLKLKNAMARLRSKGGQDSLVITGKAAYIMDVKHNMVVTAIDKKSMSENVFTKIDSTLIVD